MAGNKTADELLKWSLRQENGNGPSTAQISEDMAQGKRPDLADPKLYEALMGKSEATMMQEELTAALDVKREEEDRCTALDNFEMLIESIDNANNMTPMKMWSPLLSLLTPSPSNTPSIQTATLWIIGTAVQNNPKAQSDLLSQQSPEVLPLILSVLKNEDAGVRSKAMYALSALLKLHGKALVKFEGVGGWDVLKEALRDPAINLRRKTAFLLATLLIQDESVPAVDSSITSNSTISTPSSASRATAVAPVTPSAHPSTSESGAPLEVDPSSLLSDSASPNISSALVSSGLLKILLLSILPSGTNGREEDSEFSLAGPDGDQDPSDDLDYSEKALATIIVFVKKFGDSQKLDQQVKGLIGSVRDEMNGKAKETDGKRWKELSVEDEDWKEFENKLKSWGI